MKNFIWIYFFSAAWVLFAAPENLSVIEGNATLSTHPNHHLLIETSESAILNWDDFSIKGHEKVEFALPSIDSWVLNRVVGTKKSVIDGSFQANGNVFLINPHGIVIGPTGNIDVGGLIASTLDVLNEDFLKGKELFFSGPSHSGVINYGKIKTAYGPVTLIGRFIVNKGRIEGTTLIGAGEEVFLKLGSEPHMLVRTKKMPSEIQSSLEKGANPFQYGIDQAGTIDALSILQENGKVILKTTENIKISGEIFGNTDISAEQIEVTGKITAPGGMMTLSTKSLTYVGKSAELLAQGEKGRSGGEIFVSSEGSTHFLGRADVSGGPFGGSGGLITLSGDRDLVFEGIADRFSPKGDPGLLTLNTSAPLIINGNNHFNHMLESVYFSIHSLLADMQHGPLTVSSKGGVTLDQEISSSYNSPYSLNVFSEGQKGITLLGSLKNAGSGPLVFKALEGDLLLQGNIEAQGEVKLEAGGHLLLSGEKELPCILKTKQGNIELSALKGISLHTNAQIETEEGNLLFSSAGAISLIEQSAISTTGEGSMTFQGFSGKPIESITLKNAQITASINSKLLHIDTLSKDLNLDSTIIYGGSGGINIKQVGGDINIDGKTGPSGMFSDGPLEINVKGNLMLNASQNEAFLKANKKIQLTIGQSYLSNASEAHAKVSSLQSISITGGKYLMLNGTNEGLSSIHAPGVSIGLSHSAYLLSNSSIIAEKGSMILSAGGDISLSNPSNIKQPLISAEQLNIHSLGHFILENNARIQTRSGSLYVAGDEGLFLDQQASIIAETGPLYLSSSQGNIELFGYSEAKANSGSILVKAGRSIVLNHFSKIITLGSEGATLVVNQMQQNPSGGMIVGRNASITTGEGAKLIIYTASRSADSIEGTLNGKRVVPTPLYIETNEETWGVSFIESAQIQPPLKPKHKHPIVEFIKNNPFTQTKQPLFTLFHEEAPGLIAGVFNANDFSSIVINFVGPYVSELFRYLHPYNEFTHTFLDFNTQYHRPTQDHFTDSLSSFDILGQTTFFMRRKNFRYNTSINMIQSKEQISVH